MVNGQRLTYINFWIDCFLKIGKNVFGKAHRAKVHVHVKGICSTQNYIKKRDAHLKKKVRSS